MVCYGSKEVSAVFQKTAGLCETHFVPGKRGCIRIENLSPQLGEGERAECCRTAEEGLFRIFAPHVRRETPEKTAHGPSDGSV